MSARDGMNIPGMGNGDMTGKADMDDQVLIITCNECSFHWEADMSVYGDEKGIFCPRCGSDNCRYDEY